MDNGLTNGERTTNYRLLMECQKTVYPIKHTSIDITGI